MYRLLFLGHKPVQHVTVLNIVGNCNTMISIIILYYKVIISWNHHPICGLLLTIMSLHGAWLYVTYWTDVDIGWIHTNRVQSSPVRLTKTLWLTYNVRSCSAYRPAESSLVTQVLLSQQSWCRMFHFCQSDSSDRGWWLPYWGRNGCEKAYSFSEGPWGNSLHLALWTPELHLMLIMMFITKTTAPLTTVIMILLLSGPLFKFFIC